MITVYQGKMLTQWVQIYLNEYDVLFPDRINQ